MFDSDTRAASVVLDAIRTLFSWLDRVAFALLEFVYKLFFNVASADLFSNDTIMKFYGRVQLILGVYMMFQLAMTILKGIVNPDSFSGGKDGGGGAKLISRIATALIMLAFLTPINIPSTQNEYEEQLKSNGILFGTLYSLQHRILANNTLGRLILGNDDSSTTYFDDDGQDDLDKASRIFTSTILRGFYRINLKDESDRPRHEPGKDDAIFEENRVCEDIDGDVIDAYTRLDANPGDIISLINATCEADDVHLGVFRSIVSVFSKKLAGKQKYVFTFMPLVSTVTGLVFAVILLSFSIDVAVRAVKLAVLRLIAPIPLISYMDPKGSKDGAFNSWVKTLTSTYIDLFIRLAVIYFVIFLIQDMIVNGVVMDHGEGLVGVLTLIIIWIGLFVFAKQAPKFIKSALGMKGEDGKFFGGMGILAGAAGGISSGIVSAKASKMADEKNDEINGTDNAGKVFNRGKHLLAGISGGIMGASTGINAASGAKDHQMRAAFDAVNKRNTATMTSARSGSTFMGGVGSSLSQFVSGESTGDRLEAKWKADEEKLKYREQTNSARDAIIKRATSKGVESDKTSGTVNKTGGILSKYNGMSFNAAKYDSDYAAAQAGNKYNKYYDSAGHVISQVQYDAITDVNVKANYQAKAFFTSQGHEIELSDGALLQREIRDLNIADYAERALTNNGIDDADIRDAAARFKESTKNDVEAKFGGSTGLKAKFGEESRAIAKERSELADARNSAKTKRDIENSKYFKNRR